VHLEGGPTVERGKVYLGAGSGGALCVDLNRVTLDGKEQDLPAIQKLLDQKWEALLRQYEKDKKADPELAIPPTEDRLPQPAPVVLWKQGEKKWHVDAPVVVLDNRVLVCSAFLDKEKMGDRALFSLEASTGKVQWRTPLALNPWGGASVQGKLIVVAGSSVGYDLGALKGARGEIGAYELETGKQKWKKAVPGGIVSSLALSSEAAVCTATDGKVRAFELADGERRWIYDARAPFFAPPAIAGDVVYAADLKGVLHAIGLKDGKPLWKLDLATDRTVQAPGQVYGGPIVQGGRLYVATCNLGPEFRGKPTAVVCIGER
jgi:outer membrane protein assembly factor BamB